jgi:hypothetical protein
MTKTLPSPKDRRAWAQLLTKRRLAAFERALLDPELVSMRQELVKIDQRIAELEAAQDAGMPDHQGWQDLEAGLNQAVFLLKDDPPNAAGALAALERAQAVAAQGARDVATWEMIVLLLEQRRKIADTERKYEELYKLLIPAANLTLMFDDLHAAIEHVIQDRAIQLKLLGELRARLNGDPRARKDSIPIVLPEAYLGAGTADEAGLGGRVVGESGDDDDDLLPGEGPDVSAA